METHSDATAGNLILRHRDNRASFKNPESGYDEIDRQLSDLSRMVRDHGKTIHVKKDGFASGYTQTAVPFDLLESLRKVVNELNEAALEEQRLETCMQDLGLGDYMVDRQRRRMGLKEKRGQKTPQGADYSDSKHSGLQRG